MRFQAINIREAFAHPGPPCNATAYAPSRVYFKAHPVYGECEIVFVMGDRYGWIYPELPEKPAATLPLTHPQRFADRINAFIRYMPYGEKWYPLGIVLDKNDVPWMGRGREHFLDPEFALRSQPEICVGSFATPSVVLVGDVLHMFVCATVADPNITTGANDMRPPSGPTPYGPRGSYNDKPLWSYFVMLHYRSFTGLRNSWAIVNYANDVEHNVALQHAVAYFEPREQDRVFGRGAEFQGIGGCSAIYIPNLRGFAVSFGFSTSQWAKSGMLALDDSVSTPIGRAIYDTTKNKWEMMARASGSLPSWFIDEQMRGVLFAHTPYQLYALRQPVTIDGEQMRYAFLIAGASSDWARRKVSGETEQWAVLRYVYKLSEEEIARSWEAVGNGGGDVIEITFSSDLVTWRGHTLIAGADPNSPLLTGRAYPGSALYPMLYEDTAGMHVMFSSNANIDGTPRCFNGDGTPQSFGGLRALEADVQTVKETRV